MASFSFLIGGANINSSNIVEVKALLRKATFVNVFESSDKTDELVTIANVMATYGFTTDGTIHTARNEKASAYMSFRTKSITAAMLK